MLSWARRVTCPRRLEERPRGFTLIEILIVISIIALLSSFVLVAVNKARSGAAEAIAKTTVSSLSQALDQYVNDESDFPGMNQKADKDTNQFPELFKALFGDRRPSGPGGRSAPYMNLEENKVAVWDDDSQTYVRAAREQIRDLKIPKYLLDPWGNAYVYRANKGRRVESWMHKQYAADIYSWGPNGIDDTAEGNDNGDDIGNW